MNCSSPFQRGVTLSPWQLNIEDRPILRGGLEANLPSMRFNGPFGDCQPKPCAASLPGSIPLYAIETVEDSFARLLGNARAIVFDRQFDAV